jgi:hypothetical protein
MNKRTATIGLAFEVALAIGLIFYVDDIRWFFVYFLIVSYFNAMYWGNYLRKLIRVFQVMNEIKLLSIIKKLKITNEEGQEISDEVESQLTDEQRASLHKDMDDLGL